MREASSKSSSEKLPYIVYSSDGSNPKEIDDAVFVEPLRSSAAEFLVGVCVADTSKLYANGDVRKQAMNNVHAEYWELPDHEMGYDPMIGEEHIRSIELTEGYLHNALVVSFVIGEKVPPTDVRIEFNKIEVTKNHTYKTFSGMTGTGKSAERFGAASNLILRHIAYEQGGDSSGRNKSGEEGIPMNVSYQSWSRGARLNEAFMVAANHLVGRVLRDEGRPAIYRVHDLSDPRYKEYVETNCARYTMEPGPHQGLGVDPYCRVTSPLRRLEDFVMNYQLKQRFLRKETTKGDMDVMEQAIRTLNKRAIYKALETTDGVKDRRERMKRITSAAIARTTKPEEISLGLVAG